MRLRAVHAPRPASLLVTDPAPPPSTLVFAHALPQLSGALALLLACTPRVDSDPAPAAAPAPAAPAPAPPIPDDRRCGEAGEQPTELPPLLAKGRAPAGTGTVRPGERLTIGTVQLRYERSVWHGTMRAGFRAPGLHIEIDRAEVGEHAPWGTLLEVHPDHATRADVGPYRIDLRFGTGAPPAAIDVTVTRDVCPATAQIAPTTAPRALWVSTEGIALHTYDLQGELLQLGVQAHAGPRLDLSNLGYRHWLEPRPGELRSFRLAGHLITLDRVLPGPGTRFTDRWQADLHPRFHVRARIDPAPPIALPEPVPSDSPCGDPAPARTRLPAALAVLAPVADERRLDLGQRATLGALELDYRVLEIPAHGHGPYREEAQQLPELQILGGPLGGQTLSHRSSAPRLARLGRDLLRIDPVDRGPPDRIRVRRLALACPKELTLPAPRAPIHLWLSTIGHGYVTLTTEGRAIPLSLQLTVDDPPSLLLASEHAHFSRPLHPTLAGLGFTLDDHLVEILDLVPGDGTTFDGHRYLGSGLAPLVHVQLRITPWPAP